MQGILTQVRRRACSPLIEANPGVLEFLEPLRVFADLRLRRFLAVELDHLERHAIQYARKFSVGRIDEQADGHDAAGHFFCEARGLFDADVVEQLMNDHVTGKENHAHTLFPLMVFERWAAEHLR